MAQPLMPKATAVWLVENTSLTFEQIADYCNLHSLEVQAIADGEVAPGMHGLDPTANGQLSKDEIKRCEANTKKRMKMAKPTVPLPKARQKGARYTPISKRQDKPDAVAWLLRSYPELSDSQISRLIGTTKPTINAIRDKTHRNSSIIKPQSPVYLGLCTASDLEKIIIRARKGTNKAHEPGILPPVIPSTEHQQVQKEKETNESDTPLTAEDVFGLSSTSENEDNENKITTNEVSGATSEK